MPSDQPFGYELIIDLQKCDVSKFTRKHLKIFFIELCSLIDMEREDLHFWDYYESSIARFFRMFTPSWMHRSINCILNMFNHQIIYPEDLPTEKHLDGTSAIQFIKTSNITVHTLTRTGRVYVNIFSCKKFDPQMASSFVRKYFVGAMSKDRFIKRD